MPDEATQTKQAPAAGSNGQSKTDANANPKSGPAAAPTGETPTPRAARPNAGSAPQPAPVKATFAVGIPGAEVRQEERLIGADEPPPLPPNSDPKSLGTPTPRLDG